MAELFMYGSKVQFELPTTMRLCLVRGAWQYTPRATRTYVGRVEVIKQHQLTVYVQSEKKYIVVHPEMCKPI